MHLKTQAVYSKERFVAHIILSELGLPVCQSSHRARKYAERLRPFVRGRKRDDEEEEEWGKFSDLIAPL